MNPYYLAIDIGASSGRHILAHLEEGKMVLEEVHRFPNGMIEKDGEKVWDVDELFAQIKIGMKKCAEMNKIPVSVGVDTWGVDFVLLDKDGNRIGNAVGYRDGRTKGMDEEVYKIISEDDLYARTGIQKQMFNTIYQLMAVKKQHPEYLERMVAAYVIGFSVTEEYLANNPHLKFATGADDTGVIISYNTEGPENSDSNNCVVKEGAISINPINWKLDDTYAAIEENLGSKDEEGNSIPALADAKVDTKRGVVICTTFKNTPETKEMIAEFFGEESFHLYDYSFYHDNLRKNVSDRIEAFLNK